MLGAFYLGSWITLAFSIINAKNKKRIFRINLLVQASYSIFFLIWFNTTGPGGGILAVWVLWWFVLGIHSCINIIYMFFKRFNLRKKKRSSS